MKKIIPVTNLQRQADIEKVLQKRNDLELLQIIKESKQDIQNGKMLSHDDVKKRLNLKKN